MWVLRSSVQALAVLSLAGLVALASACSSAATDSTGGDSGRGPGKDGSGGGTGPDGSGGGGTDGGGGGTGPDGGSGETGADGSGGGIEAGKDASGTDVGADAGIDAAKDASGTDAAKDAGDSGSSTTSPFDCKFAWGEPDPTGSLSTYTWLSFVTNWAGYEIEANGSIDTFDNGSFLTQVTGTSLIPTYYSYLIGYYGHANALPDQNCCGTSCTTCTATQPNLSTGAAYLLLGDPTGANAPCGSTTTFCDKNLIVEAYAYYAQQTYKAWPTKPFVWLIEGDFIQYTDTTQVASLTSTTGASAALSYAQLGQLAALIASAIKTNMPNAVVAFDDSAWIDDTDRPLYWAGSSAPERITTWCGRRAWATIRRSSTRVRRPPATTERPAPIRGCRPIRERRSSSTRAPARRSQTIRGRTRARPP